jgi:hypothetical protein
MCCTDQNDVQTVIIGCANFFYLCICQFDLYGAVNPKHIIVNAP